MLAAKALGRIHVCTGSPEPSIQYQNIIVLVEMAIFATLVCTANDVVSLHQQPQESVQPSVRCINASKNAPSAL